MPRPTPHIASETLLVSPTDVKDMQWLAPAIPGISVEQMPLETPSDLRSAVASYAAATMRRYGNISEVSTNDEDTMNIDRQTVIRSAAAAIRAGSQVVRIVARAEQGTPQEILERFDTSLGLLRRNRAALPKFKGLRSVAS